MRFSSAAMLVAKVFQSLVPSLRTERATAAEQKWKA
jgi:hypothetical protein